MNKTILLSFVFALSGFASEDFIEKLKELGVKQTISQTLSSNIEPIEESLLDLEESSVMLHREAPFKSIKEDLLKKTNGYIDYIKTIETEDSLIKFFKENYRKNFIEEYNLAELSDEEKSDLVCIANEQSDKKWETIIKHFKLDDPKNIFCLFKESYVDLLSNDRLSSFNSFSLTEPFEKTIDRANSQISMLIHKQYNNENFKWIHYSISNVLKCLLLKGKTNQLMAGLHELICDKECPDEFIIQNLKKTFENLIKQDSIKLDCLNVLLRKSRDEENYLKVAIAKNNGRFDGIKFFAWNILLDDFLRSVSIQPSMESVNLWITFFKLKKIIDSKFPNIYDLIPDSIIPSEKKESFLKVFFTDDEISQINDFYNNR